MATTQDERLLAINTPLGKDFLLLNTFSAKEGLSQLFTIEAELLHEEDEASFNPTVIDPKDILGKGVTISVGSPDGVIRDYSGIVVRFTQGNRNVRFSYYNATIVPHVWVLTQISQSQILQQITVPDILKKLFEGFQVIYQLQRTYEQRNYCVQYRETNFAFASRLMEEEGIFYYFIHVDGKDVMVIADTPQSHPVCPTKDEIPFFVKVGTEENFVGTINSFLSGHILQTGKVTLWDNNFQLPGKSLDRETSSQFTYGDNKNLEAYDFPGGYGRKYDGISKSGGDQEGELQKVFEDRSQTTSIRLEQLDSQVETATGRSDCCSITAGHKFTLKDHPNSELNKTYTIISSEHRAEQSPSYVSNDDVTQPYTNDFKCIEMGSGRPGFRPARTTPKPTMNGSQTAFVVGPAGEEIFVDKYGRVKVQFHWDRDGQSDADSSCWVRVAQAWAGSRWGATFIPRIGMEVLVHFLEGDPDQPIITGCVYNPSAMPPYTLPDEKTKSTVKTNSTKGGGGFNEFRFEDKKGHEQIFVHGQRNLDIRIRSDRRELIGNDRHLIVKRDKRELVERDEHIIIKRDQIEQIKRDYHRKVEGKIAFETSGSVSHKIGGSRALNVGGNNAIDVGGQETIKANIIVLEADTGITLKCGGSSININAGGIQIIGSPMLMLNSGGSPMPAMPGSPVPPLDPQEAEIADNADPGSNSPTYKHQRRAMPPGMVPSYSQPYHKHDEPDPTKKSWVEIELKDEDGDPVPGERYRVTLPDGTTLAEGTLDEKGFARVEHIDPGNCKITFPRLDGQSWKPE